MRCKICQEDAQPVFTALILKKYDVTFYRCVSCFFMQTEDPYWLNEAYESPINISDTGIILRNEILKKKVSCIICFQFNRHEKFIDYAGGYGIFTRMMRDIGFDFYWIDEYANNLLARGFEHRDKIKYEATTAFEVFEHLASPLQEIEKMFLYGDTVIFSTVLLPDHIPAKDWWYYGFNHGQHVALYHYKTLDKIAKILHLNFYSDGKELHILSKKKLNRVILKLTQKLSKFGLYNVVRLLVKSKTHTDHLLLANK